MVRSKGPSQGPRLRSRSRPGGSLRKIAGGLTIVAGVLAIACSSDQSPTKARPSGRHPDGGADAGMAPIPIPEGGFFKIDSGSKGPIVVTPGDQTITVDPS